MHRLGIGIVATGLLIVLSILRSASLAEGQGQALIEAAQKGDLNQVQKLLENGADVDARDKIGATALMYASFWGRAEVVKALLAKEADVNAKASDGSTALKLASMKSNADVVELLKAHGAKE